MLEYCPGPLRLINDEGAYAINTELNQEQKKYKYSKNFSPKN